MILICNANGKPRFGKTVRIPAFRLQPYKTQRQKDSEKDDGADFPLPYHLQKMLIDCHTVPLAH